VSGVEQIMPSIDIRRLSRPDLSGDHLNGQRFKVGQEEYMLGGTLGNGAIGVVRRATRIKNDRIYAIKFLAPEPAYIEMGSIESVEGIYRRFKREGERGAKLDHSNLVEIITYQENDQGENFVDTTVKRPLSPFIIMEFIRGRTLETYLINSMREYPVGQLRINRETLHIACEIARAVVYLHAKSLTHRDVKPANIFLSRNPNGQLPKEVKLGDFGIVKWGDFKASISTGTLTVPGQQGLGTLKYMAPEQTINPESVDIKSDVYSLGVTLFELFTNQILADIHHVYQIHFLRRDRGHTLSRLHTLKINFPPELYQYEFLLEQIFDCFLSPSGRPTSTSLYKTLFRLLNNLE
jgi:eukaryotic-like serine/threonine-protein kinase